MRGMDILLIVAKAGGRVLESGMPLDVAEDICEVTKENRFVFVHGGGIEVTELAKKLGKEQKFVISPEGFRSRYTDRETMDIFTMVMAGRLNKQVVLMLESKGVKTIGLSGLDGGLIRAERKKRLVVINERGRRQVIDGGYTGSISEINAELLNLLLNSGYVPVISPVAMSEEFEPLNVDGDRVAAKIAAALKADILVLLTDVEGVALEGKTVSRLGLNETREILPKIGPGMITKLQAATEALENGVKEVVISSGQRQRPISSAINHQVGTVISNG